MKSQTVTPARLAELIACEKLVVELAESNIANIDYPADRFVKCFTYGIGVIPPHWRAALRVVERVEGKPVFKSIRAGWAAQRAKRAS